MSIISHQIQPLLTPKLDARAACIRLSMVLTVVVGLAACQGDPTAPTPLEAVGKKPVGIATITVLDLGGLGTQGSVAQDINDNGQIVGYAFSAAGTRAFLYQNGETSDLGVPTGMAHAQAAAINVSGTVVGVSFDASTSRAFVWSSGSGMQLLTQPSGSCCSGAQDINATGVVVGEYQYAVGVSHAVTWTGGTPQDIHSGPDGSRSMALGVNNAGQVVGQYWADASDPGQSFSWTATGGFVLIAPFGTTRGGALDVDDNGNVVGWGGLGILQAYLFNGGATTELGTLGGAGSVAIGINGQDQVVGRADKRRGQTAFLWTAADGMRDLGLPRGSSFGQAWAINNVGSAVGETSGRRGRTQATLWQLLP